ncbi:MAG: class I SAM-dependent methyltransferase [Chloroflexota bacterium]
MKADYLVHDQQYKAARAKGWSGWGGNERMAHEHIWLNRLFSFAGVPETGTALELGCGEGHYSRLLADRGYQVTGVDVSPTAIAWAEEKTAVSGHQIEFIVRDLTKPNLLSNRAFDIIGDGNCLHCIIGADRATFLENVHRLLKPNGVFFISTKCSNSDEDELTEFEGKPYRFAPSLKNLHQELETAGFVIEKSDFHYRDIKNSSHCTLHLTKRSA